MKTRTKRIIAGAGTAALMTVGTAFAASTAQAAQTTEPESTSAATTQAAGTKASCRSSNEANWLIPDGSGSWAGKLYWNDYNEYTGSDQDNFSITDRPLDGQSSSLWVKNNHTGKTYYKHVYSGDGYCMGVGNIPNGKTASWKACGWDDGTAVKCKTGTVKE